MQRVAIIGGGIAGLAAARRLAGVAEVTLLEARDELGGHVRTIDADDGVAIDCGFIVFNHGRYPHFTRMLRELDVRSQPSVMSFGVSAADGSFAYSTRTPRTLFAHPGSLRDPGHHRLVRHILGFLWRARGDQRLGSASGMTLRDYLAWRGASDDLATRFVLPLAGALWSAGAGEAGQLPAEVFLGFLHAHGMLRPAFAPPWRTVVGGASTYVRALRESLADSIDWRVGVRVSRVRRGASIELELADGSQLITDRLIIATHADQALAMLGDADADERAALSAIRYTSNEVVVHTDESRLPVARAARAAWNYRVSSGGDADVTYWSNRLQRLPTSINYMVTLNPRSSIEPARVIARTEMSHPRFDLASLEARRQLSRRQGRRSTYFAGAYFGFGFHEDGFRAGLAAATALLADGAARRALRAAA